MTTKIKGYTIGMLVLYTITLLACFICDLAINGSLTWFYMVLIAIFISFSITNLPFIVQKGKVVIPALATTDLTYLLLFVCCIYTKGDWLLSFAYPITTFSFVAAWILLFVFKSRKLRWAFKTSIALLISGIFTLVCNLLVVTLSKDAFDFMNLFFSDAGVANGIVSGCLIAGAIISAGIGLILLMRKPSVRSDK